LSARSSRGDEWARRSATSPHGDGDESEGRPLLSSIEAATAASAFAVGRGAVSFTDFSLRLPGSNQYILRHATGRFQSGKLTAILGGSGCGKTSLVSYVAGHSSAIPGGQLYVNASVVGYVPQEAVLLEQLTVYENLMFSASLRRPAWESSEERRQVVDDVIRAVDLNKVRHGRVGSAKSRGLSGGQKSRLSFAFEAVASPTLILADEITSGVDSTTSMDLLRNLRLAAEDGAAVAAILHQPRYECIALFDMLLVLSREGRTAYFGKASEALDHFLSLGFVLPQFTNPYDLIIDAVQGECFPANDDWRTYLPHLARGVQWHPNMLADIFEEVLEPGVREDNAAYVALEQEESDSPAASQVAEDFLHASVGIARQFALVLWASWLEMLRTVRTLVSDAVLLCVSGLIVGVLFPFDVKVFQILEVGFLLSVVLGSSAALGAVRVFGTGRLMYERTSASGLSTLAYFLAKVALQLVQVIVLPSAFLAMFYSIAAPRGLLVDYMSISIATYWAASGLGIWTGAMIAPERAQLASVVFVLISIFFAGFEPKLPEFRENSTTWIFLGPITSLSFARWTVASIFSAETGRFPPVFRFTIDAVAKKYGYDGLAPASAVNLGLLALFGQGLLWRSLAFIALLMAGKKK
jgi:ABC-type multidrug transport system ATPase subunit